MTQDELRDAVLAALLDYETFKKNRRSKAIKQAFRGTVMATVIGSTGITGASDARGSQTGQTLSSMASSPDAAITNVNPPQDLWKDKVIWGAVYFGSDQHKITRTGENQLRKLIKRLPRYAELTVIGCTDSKGEPQYNERLGRQRAQTVANFLSMQGIKIKNVTNLLSSNKHAGWLARRVDIVVNSSFSSQIKHPAFQQDVQLFEDHDFETSKTTVKTHPIEDIAVQNEKNPPRSIDDKAIRGVAHFGFDQHRLTAMHKERLLDLIKQLPADAELTVIGRTDSNGGDDYNKQLGMLRSKTVAIFLANHGLKIKAIGSKLSHHGESGWNARRVDIVVNTSESKLNIKLPEPAQTAFHRVKTHHKKSVRPAVAVEQKNKITAEADINQWKQRAQKLLDTQLK